MADDENLTAEVERLKAENAQLARDLKAARTEVTKATTEASDLKAQVEKSVNEHESLWEKHKALRAENKDHRLNVEALTAKVASVEGERDEWKTKFEASSPEAFQKTIDDLKGQLRGITHKQAFELACKALKVTDQTAIADLYILSGYQPDSDEVDPAKLTEVVANTLKSRPRYVDAEASTTTPAPTPTTQQSAAEAATKAPEGAPTKPEGSGASNGAAKQGQWGQTQAKPAAPAAKPAPGADRGQSVDSTTAAVATGPMKGWGGGG